MFVRCLGLMNASPKITGLIPLTLRNVPKHGLPFATSQPKITGFLEIKISLLGLSPTKFNYAMPSPVKKQK